MDEQRISHTTLHAAATLHLLTNPLLRILFALPIRLPFKLPAPELPPVPPADALQTLLEFELELHPVDQDPIAG